MRKISCSSRKKVVSMRNISHAKYLRVKPRAEEEVDGPAILGPAEDEDVVAGLEHGVAARRDQLVGAHDQHDGGVGREGRGRRCARRSPPTAAPGRTTARSRAQRQRRGDLEHAPPAAACPATSTPSRRAAQRTVAPGMSVFTTTTKKTTSKMWCARGAPASTGKIARMIGHRAAQADPADEGDLAQRGSGTAAGTAPSPAGRATSASTSAEREPDPADGEQARRKAEQAEHEEHHDLAEPGDRVVHAQQAAAIGQRRRCRSPARRRRRRESRCRAPASSRRRRRSASAMVSTGQRPARGRAHAARAASARRSRRPTPPATPTDELERDLERERASPTRAVRVCAAVSATVRITATGSLRPDSSSSVAATRRDSSMRLPRRTEKTAAASVDETMAPNRSASRPREAEQRARPTRDDRRRSRRRRRWRARRRARARAARCASEALEAAVEQDEHERHGAEAEGERVVLEVDAADAFGAGEHADDEEEQRDRDAGAAGDAAGDHAQPHEQAEQRERDRGRGELVHARIISVAMAIVVGRAPAESSVV